jgi:capsular exopolysaccharide synthesis family protein
MDAAMPRIRTLTRDEERSAIAEQLVSLRAPGSFAADQYRTLRHSVERLRRSAGLQILGVTSSGAGEGKSITALNLAGTLAQARNARILIVDADLRRPAVSHYLGLEPPSSGGLAEAIQNPTRELSDAVTHLERFNLSVLPAGPPQNAPYELLNAPRVETLLKEARGLYEYILIDTPPLVPFPDCRVLARHIDGFLVIVAAHKTPRKLLMEGLSLLDPAKVIGLVFNGDDEPRSAHYGYYGDYNARDRSRRW